MNLEAMNDYLGLLRADACRMFPGAVSVRIVISAESVDVTPLYQKTGDKEARTIDGGWC